MAAGCSGIGHNIQVGIQYIGSWLSGNGRVPIFNLMEDVVVRREASRHGR